MKYVYEMNNSELRHILCPCGEIHEVCYPIVSYASVIEVVEEVMSAGHVLCIREEEIDGRIFDTLKRAGAWRVTEESILPYQTDYTLDIDDDVRLIVAVGGATVINISKELAYQIGARLVVLPIYAYDECVDSTSRVLREGRLECRRGRRPDRVVVDYDVVTLCGREYLISGYATLGGHLGALNDYVYRSMRESKYCPHIVKAIRSAIVPLAKARAISMSMARSVSDTLLRVTMLMSILPSLDSGATQLADVIHRYLYSKTSDVRTHGENLLYTSAIIGKLYETYLRNCEMRLTIPPNRGDDIEKMRRLLGVDEFKSLTHARGYIEEVDRESYLMSVLRPRLYTQIRVNNIIIDMLRECLFDSYEDKGYFMRGYIGVREMFKLLALAPEYMRGDTMLTYIKDTGLLEKLG